MILREVGTPTQSGATKQMEKYCCKWRFAALMELESCKAHHWHWASIRISSLSKTHLAPACEFSPRPGGSWPADHTCWIRHHTPAAPWLQGSQSLWQNYLASETSRAARETEKIKTMNSKLDNSFHSRWTFTQGERVSSLLRGMEAIRAAGNSQGILPASKHEGQQGQQYTNVTASEEPLLQWNYQNLVLPPPAPQFTICTLWFHLCLTETQTQI